MKRFLLAGSAVTALLLSSQAFAQTVEFEIAPEQRTHIREYITRERIPRAVVKERYRVGSTLPTEVELHESRAEWGPSARRYRYYHGPDGIHFVDPESRRVIYDIDD